ncbi:MAG TPA: ATP-binding protein [Jatrophihabitans sp.]|nr:ATP-binding protein [Jatrophihabitans sp.]
MATLWVRHAPASAAVARRSVSAAFEQAGVTADEAYDAALIASELVGNAVRHGLPLPSGHIAVDWSLDGASYRISVTDGGRAPQIEPRSAAVQDTSGRGLMIVAALASQWGVDSDGPGTRVWVVGVLSRPTDRRDDDPSLQSVS